MSSGGTSEGPVRSHASSLSTRSSTGTRQGASSTTRTTSASSRTGPSHDDRRPAPRRGRRLDRDPPADRSPVPHGGGDARLLPGGMVGEGPARAPRQLARRGG